MTREAGTVTVCSSCPLGQTGFAEDLRNKLSTTMPEFEVATRDCMSGCTQPSTVAIRSVGKTAYLFGEMEPGDLPLIENFLMHYRESKTGDFEDARVLGELRFRAIARIPG